jgi:hypothetical protein
MLLQADNVSVDWRIPLVIAVSVAVVIVIVLVVGMRNPDRFGGVLRHLAANVQHLQVGPSGLKVNFRQLVDQAQSALEGNVSGKSAATGDLTVDGVAPTDSPTSQTHTRSVQARALIGKQLDQELYKTMARESPRAAVASIWLQLEREIRAAADGNGTSPKTSAQDYIAQLAHHAVITEAEASSLQILGRAAQYVAERPRYHLTSEDALEYLSTANQLHIRLTSLRKR